MYVVFRPPVSINAPAIFRPHADSCEEFMLIGERMNLQIAPATSRMTFGTAGLVTRTPLEVGQPPVTEFWILLGHWEAFRLGRLSRSINPALGQSLAELGQPSIRDLRVVEIKHLQDGQSLQTDQPIIRDQSVVEIKRSQSCQLFQMNQPGICDLCVVEIKRLQAAQSFQMGQPIIRDLSIDERKVL